VTEVTERGFLAYDIVHAVEFSRIGRSCSSPSPDLTQGNCPVLPDCTLLELDLEEIRSRRCPMDSDWRPVKALHPSLTSLSSARKICEELEGGVGPA
jgi:hypothetical protein